MREFLKKWLQPSARDTLISLHGEDPVEFKHLYFMNFKVQELKAHRRSHDGIKLAWKKSLFY